MTASAEEIVSRLGLEPHAEGGFFRETYRSSDTVQTARGSRSLCTAILFLVTAQHPSRFHRITSDEVWVYQGGDPLELAILPASATGCEMTGTGAAATAVLDLVDGTDAQVLVPAHAWQAARVADRREGAAASLGQGAAGWSLVACVVSPGFDYADFELADRQTLLADWPDLRTLILALT